MPILHKKAKTEMTMLMIFSPIELDTVEKLSAIWEGSYSMFYLSKNEISYFNKALMYLPLKLTVIFSAKCYEKARQTYEESHVTMPMHAIHMASGQIVS
jgi:hypothetical protein